MKKDSVLLNEWIVVQRLCHEKEYQFKDLCMGRGVWIETKGNKAAAATLVAVLTAYGKVYGKVYH